MSPIVIPASTAIAAAGAAAAADPAVAVDVAMELATDKAWKVHDESVAIHHNAQATTNR